jgi:hypothetical protein
VSVKAVEMKNIDLLKQVAAAKNIEYLGSKVFNLYAGQTAEGHGFQLKGWRYPVVINTESGTASYDTFNGSWGHQSELDSLVQDYVAASNLQQAALNGYMLASQTTDEQGNITQVFESAFSA